MHRTLISWPHIGSYSALLLAAFVAGWWLARRSAPRVGIAPRHIDNITLLTVVAALFGARLFSWLFYLPPGIGFLHALTMSGGGLVFYGGLIFGIGTVVTYGLIARINLLDLLDSFAAPAALGLALGRVGCFMAGCCWGDVCLSQSQLAALPADVRYQVQTLPVLSGAHFPLAVTFPRDTGAIEQHRDLHLIPANADRSLPVHPVQLYEAFFAFLLAFVVHRTFKHRLHSGQIAARLVLGYALLRFTVEFFRADNQPRYWGLTISQVVSIVMVLGCIAVASYRAAGRTSFQASPAP